MHQSSLRKPANHYLSAQTGPRHIGFAGHATGRGLEVLQRTRSTRTMRSIDLRRNTSKLLDLDSLHIFVRASELGSFSKVADQKHLALAAVSRRIAQLEFHYGVTLFLRTGRVVALTPAGQALLGHAKEILRKVNATRADISDFAKGVRGSVRLYACTSAISQFLPKDLAAFHRQYPDIRLDIIEGRSLEIVVAIREGAADVGVIVAGPHPIDLPTTAYRRDKLAVVAP